MYGLTLIAVLAVMGGVIAYIGDKLGTKIGKKKLTIFGLRPKHTSILVTIVTGILIAATTLGILTVASRDVRTALFGMAALKAELASLSQEVSSKNLELETSRRELAAKTAEYTALSDKVKETAQQLALISRELDEVMAERDRTAAALSRVQTEYAQAKGDLSQAQQEIKTLQTTKQELDKRVAELSTAKTNLQQDVDRLNELTANLKKGIQYVREGVVVFRAGEEIATAIVKGGQSVEDTQQALGALVYRTNLAITGKLGIDNNLEVLWISRHDFDEAVSLIAATPEDVVVRITSVGNTIYGEPVIGRIDLYPNRLVYSQGTVVYSQVINAGQSAEQAEEAVLLFLRRVNAEAVKQGILPDPLQGTVGSMSGAQLFETVNKVKRYGGKVELTAVTKADIYTAGPLQIEIQVRSVL